ncbi:ROK family protein [Halovenus rubra]|uniref:ROK family protein n=2 Tax=Halovenus rubra TaxID=869890 RepID=A0ABD5X4G7_9EURY|nr:ROK family protein [Halovenus rubra]
MAYFVGIDVGGTTIKTAIAADDTDRLATHVVPTPQAKDGQTVTNAVLDSVKRVCEESGVRPEMITAAGIGSVGPLNRVAGTVTGPANISGENIQLVKPLAEKLDTEAVVLHNDAVCGVIAERHIAEVVPENMLYLTLSTGIGAGIVIDGHLIHGTGGNVGEIGHMTVDPAGTMACGCGRNGHWEAYCGGANIPRYAALLSRTESIDTALTLNDACTAKDVFQQAGSDALATLVVERVARWNTIGIANLIQAYAPASIAVGGAVARNHPKAVLEPVRDRLPKYVFGELPQLGLAACETDIVLTGALLAAQRCVDGSG